MKFMKFNNGSEMYDYLCSGRDLYSKRFGIYAFEYNDASALCIYYLHPENVAKLVTETEGSDEYWGGFLGLGGCILDDPDYDEYRYSDDEEKRNMYLKPSIDFCNETYMVEDWMDTKDVTVEYVMNKSEGNDMSRVDTVMKALKVKKEDALKIVEHLTNHDCLEWIDDYKEGNRINEPLVDVHYENNFEDMINWQYEDYKPSEMLGMSDDIEDYREMLELDNKVIFWYGLV